MIAHTGLKGNRSEPKLTANFYVLRASTMAAVLLELGFMDSKIDVPIILTEKFAQQCAAAIVEVIAKRGKLTKKAKTEVKEEAKPWYADAQAWVKEKGISDGTKHSTAATRAEVWDMLYRALRK